MATIRLSHALGSIKLTQARVTAENSDLHQRLQKSDLLNGKRRTYDRVNDDGIMRAPEAQRVQLVAQEALKTIVNNYRDLSDIEACRDYGNTVAKANVTIDGIVLIKDAPPTFLLFLDTQLSHLRVIIEKTVTLDQSHTWELDPQTGLQQSEAAQTLSTEKVQAALTLVQPTDKHPGQAQMITKDVTVGTWTTVHFSGALPYARRVELIARIERLQKAVEEALAECNATKVDKLEISGPLYDYLLK